VTEVSATEEDFAQAAARAAAAGFGLIEAHGAHGYLLDSFLSAQSNLRKDDYGGSILGRMRMLVETCRRMRDRIGTRALLCSRISLFNKQPEEVSREDLHRLLRALGEAGVDVLHLSTDGALKGCFGSDKTIGQWAREMTELPIMVAGGLGDPRVAEQAVLERHADFAAVGSAMMEDPDWTAHAAEGLGA
jgi:2,4-dienoyl-CoA reductase-like NADH-dependent reductase (Old Yellow Enzyme family)